MGRIKSLQKQICLENDDENISRLSSFFLIALLFGWLQDQVPSCFFLRQPQLLARCAL